MAQGKAQGIAKGQAEGRAEEQKKFLAESKRKARNMFIRGISLEDALLFSPLKKIRAQKIKRQVELEARESLLSQAEFQV